MATPPSGAARRTREQVWTAVGIGAVLTLIGILGFVLVPDEGALLDLFGVNTLHNAVHLLTGIGGLGAGYLAAGAYADEYNKYGGVAYLLVAILWLIVPAFLDRLLNVGPADTLLHFGLGMILAVVGFGLAGRLGGVR